LLDEVAGIAEIKGDRLAEAQALLFWRASNAGRVREPRAKLMFLTPGTIPNDCVVAEAVSIIPTFAPLVVLLTDI
jgi:hypothetical protein